MILVCHVISQDRMIKEGPYDLIDTQRHFKVCKTSIQHQRHRTDAL